METLFSHNEMRNLGSFLDNFAETSNNDLVMHPPPPPPPASNYPTSSFQHHPTVHRQPSLGHVSAPKSYTPYQAFPLDPASNHASQHAAAMADGTMLAFSQRLHEERQRLTSKNERETRELERWLLLNQTGHGSNLDSPSTSGSSGRASTSTRASERSYNPSPPHTAMPDGGDAERMMEAMQAAEVRSEYNRKVVQPATENAPIGGAPSPPPGGMREQQHERWGTTGGMNLHGSFAPPPPPHHSIPTLHWPPSLSQTQSGWAPPPPPPLSAPQTLHPTAFSSLPPPSVPSPPLPAPTHTAPTSKKRKPLTQALAKPAAAGTTRKSQAWAKPKPQPSSRSTPNLSAPPPPRPLSSESNIDPNPAPASTPHNIPPAPPTAVPPSANSTSTSSSRVPNRHSRVLAARPRPVAAAPPSLKRSQSPSSAPSNSRGPDGKPVLLSAAQKKANHIASEQKRRAAIRVGYEGLCRVVPTLRVAVEEFEANKGGKGGGGGKKRRGSGAGGGGEDEKVDGRAGPKSENVVLGKTVDYVRQLLSTRQQLLGRLSAAYEEASTSYGVQIDGGERIWEKTWDLPIGSSTGGASATAGGGGVKGGGNDQEEWSEDE